MNTIIETIGILNPGDKFTTYQEPGVFTIISVFDKSIHAYNSENIYTYNIDTYDLIKLKINLI
jgi:hypothetical protein